MRIDEFLLARIAEDEAVAWVASRHNDPAAYAKDNYGCLLVDPARVVAECAAKRAVVAEVQAASEIARWVPEASTRLVLKYGMEVVIRHLAAVYADHPDYRDDWRV